MKVTADDIAQLLASSPPRLVPDHVAKAAKGGRGAWTAILFGLFFGGFGSLFLVVFFPWKLGEELRLATGSTRAVSGIVADAYKTNMSVNKQKVFGYVVDYAADASGRHRITCFTTGQRWANGASVSVRYLVANPAVACIDGARLNEGGIAGGFVIIFPLVGFGLAGWTFSRRTQTTRVLREGIAAEVDIVAVDATGMKVNDQTVYKITLASPALPGGQPVTIKRYSKPDVNLATQHAEQKQPVFVLYDPRKPSRVVFPEALIDP